MSVEKRDEEAKWLANWWREAHKDEWRNKRIKLKEEKKEGFSVDLSGDRPKFWYSKEWWQ